jgi:hypothetical protein
MKNILLTFLMLSFFSHLSGQGNKMFVSLEYSPNFTSTTNPFGISNNGTFRFASNIFAKAGYRVTRNLYANAGIGYLNTKDFFSADFNAQSEYDRIEQLRRHAYVITPVGFTYFMGSFFVSPEIGIGWNVSNSMKDVIYLQDGSSTGNEWVDEHNIYDVNEATYPLLLSIGNEIKFNSWSLMLGMKGYYSLNSIGQRATNAGHYYGFGIMTGVKF